MDLAAAARESAMHARALGLLVAVSALLSLAGCGRCAQAAPAGLSLYSLTEENDGIVSHEDRHYTQGIMLARTATVPSGGFWDGISDGFDRVARWLGAGPAVARRYRWPVVGQSLFTPADIETASPPPGMHPYAGWLYVGAGLQRRDRSGRLDQFQVLLGVVGPWALGEELQAGFHALAGYRQPDGWDHQLHNEPGLIATYQTSWDWPLLQAGTLESDVLPEAGISVGNVLAYGDAGFILRLGRGLAAGGAPQTITPGLSGSGWFDPARLDGDYGWMLFAGAQTRAVGHNLFLQGNSFRHSAGVRQRDFVTDADAGFSLLFRVGLRADFVYVRRAREFVGQPEADNFGSVTLSVPWAG